MVNGKKLGEVGFQYLGVPYSEMDCQKFVERCLKDCGDSTDFGGSNSWYREVMKHGWVGTPEQCKAKLGYIPTGAFLFILEPVSDSTPAKFKNDGVGDATHIGIVTNRGDGAIHSSHSKGCVCQSKFDGKTIKGGWNRVGLWDRVDYLGEEEDDPMETVATVHSENGGSVKLRQKPSTSCSMYWDVPNGSLVTLLDWGETWSKIVWDGITGYMKSEFLIRGEVVPGEPDLGEGDITVPRERLIRIYDLLGEILGMGVG